MRIERTKNARRGIAAGGLLKICQMLLPFLMRTAMIQILGVQYLGLNSLFSSVLHVLNLAELGVGTAMVFSMYKPIAEDDEKAVCALMGLYRKYYRIIGIVVGVVGVALLPAIPSLISGEIPSELNVYTLYLLNLGAAVLSYWLFAYRNCLLQAHQRNDIISVIAILTSFLQYGVQFAVLLIFRNYYLYVIIILATQVVNNVITAAVTKKLYPQYKPQGALLAEEVRKINQKVRDLFTGKLGVVIVQSADTIVISSFLGLTTLAVYQNYNFILTSVLSTIEIIPASMMAGLGNSFCTETREKNYRDMEVFTFLLLWLSGVGTCCFLGIYQPFMRLWVGEELMLDMRAVLCFAIYFFVYELNRLLNVYKDAAGLWHEDRFRPLITAAVNLTLNLLLARRWGVYGVLLSTVISMVAVGIPWVLQNLFTLFYEKALLRGYIRLILSFVGVTVLSGFLVSGVCMCLHGSEWVILLVCMLVSVLVPLLLFWLLFRKHRLFRPSVQFLDKLTKNKLKIEERLFSKNG